MLEHSLILLSGLVSGLILFQSAINAPLIFKTLDRSHAGPLLRRIFPILFKVIAVLGALMLTAAWLGGANPLPVWVGGLTLVCALTCALLVPATNRATDTGNEATFHRLHLTSVVLTVGALLANLCWPFFA